MGIELVSYELDNRSVLRALAEINQGIERTEGNITGKNDRLAQSFQRVSDFLVKTFDKEVQANERRVRSLELYASTVNKSPVEKLIAQRDAFIKKLGNEEDQIKRVTATYQKLIEAQKGSGENGLAKFGETVKQFIEAPMQTAGASATGLLTTLGPLGAGFAGVATAAIAVGVALFEVAKGFAEDAERLVNLSHQTGISVGELDKLSAMAKIVGVDISSLARAGSSMATTLDSGGAKAKLLDTALGRLKISTVDLSGAQKEGGQILTETLLALSKIPDATERIALANETLGPRVARNILPIIKDYDELRKSVEGMGYGMDGQILKADEAAQSLHKVDLAWQALKRQVANPIEGLINFVVKVAGPGTGGGSKVSSVLGFLGKNVLPAGYGAAIEAGEAYNDATTQQEGLTALRRQPGISGSGAELATQYGLQQRKSGIDLQYMDPKEKLEAFKKSQEELATALEHNGMVAAKDVAQYDQYKKNVEETKNAIKALTEAETLRKHNLEQLKSGLLAVYQIQDALNKKESLLPQTTAAFGKSSLALARPQIERVLFQESLEQTIKYQTEFEKIAAKGKGSGNPDSDSFVNEASKEAISTGLNLNQMRANKIMQDAASKRAAYIAEQKSDMSLSEAQALGANKLAGMTANTPAAKLANEEQGLEIKKQFAQKQLQVELDLTNEKYLNDASLQERLLKLKTDNAKQVYEIELQQQEAIAKEYERQFNEIKGKAEALAHTLFTHPKNFTKQLKSTVIDAALKPGEEAIGNLAGALGMSAKMGTQNPVKLSTDANTLATGQNTGAIANLTNLLAAATGQSAVAVPSGAATGGVSVRTFSVPTGSSGGPLGAISRLATDVESIPSYRSGSGSGSPGSVTSSIDYGEGAIPLGGSVYGGPAASPISSILGRLAGGPNVISTPSFSGAAIPGLSRGGSSPFGGLFKGVRGFNPAQFGVGTATKNTESVGMYGDTVSDSGTSFGSVLTSGGAASLMTSAGMPLAMAGLFGGSRGTGKGFLESTAGGALTGAGIGTMILPGLGTAIGAGIGAGVGALTSGIEALTGDISPQNKAKKMVKSVYGITISNQEAAQIANIAQSKYAGNVSIAVHSPEVRSMLGLYAAGTGQKNGALSSSVPQAASLVEQNSTLYQQATYKYGQAMTFQSKLPVYGGTPSTVTNPGTGLASNAPINLSLNVDGKGAGDFMAGNVVTPDFIQNGFAAAQLSGNGRTSNAAQMMQPGLLT